MSERESFDPDLLNTVDIKTERNSRSYNFSIHIYEHCTEKKIDEAIRLALYAIREYNNKLDTLSEEQRLKDDEKKAKEFADREAAKEAKKKQKEVKDESTA